MIRSVEIEGYKSVAKVTLDLGRVNVLIGENGAGKSNVLEAIAIGGAADGGMLLHEFLAARGIRAVEPELMLSAFTVCESIRVAVKTELGVPSAEVVLERADGVELGLSIVERGEEGLVDFSLEEMARDGLVDPDDYVAAAKKVVELILNMQRRNRSSPPKGDPWHDFLIYSPEYAALRIFSDETQILPLGIRGEGLFSYLKMLAKRDEGEALKKISNELDLIDWFDGFELPNDLAPGERTLRIRDRYLVDQKLFDQRSANEGFLFLLFYFTLLISPDTPAFFAVDNIDASLNPKLCTVLVRRIISLSREHDKQVILTTHSPAVLDGLNLEDDDQRLFVISRDTKGQTRARRIAAPKPLGDDPPVRLSEAFMRGHLGGLPKNF